MNGNPSPLGIIGILGCSSSHPSIPMPLAAVPMIKIFESIEDLGPVVVDFHLLFNGVVGERWCICRGEI